MRTRGAIIRPGVSVFETRVGETRGEGVTESERFLYALCSRTFLRLWSYPNLYNDKGLTRLKRGQELCDLLVVFGDHVIIFSDKHCKFPEDIDVKVAWKRWYKRAIQASADQIFGAERWLREFPQRVFIDPLCKTALPVDLPDSSLLKVHRVVVARGAGAAAERHFGGGSSGSLMHFNWLNGSDHTADDAKPFTVGQVDRARGFVHVFDDVTLSKVLFELDTADDFVTYLVAKERLLGREQKIMVHGEEELLAYFLSLPPTAEPIDLLAQHRDENLALVVAEGLWDEYKQGPIAKIRHQMTLDGQLVDALIEHFSDHVLAGSLAYGADRPISSHERNLRFLAAEPRHHRALMSQRMLEKLRKTPEDARSGIALASSKSDTLYVFLLFPKSEGQDEDDYRRERQEWLDAYCLVAKFKFRTPRYIVGIATQPGMPHFRRSEDLISFDFESWNEQSDVQAAQLQQEMQIFVDYQTKDSRAYYKSLHRGGPGSVNPSSNIMIEAEKRRRRRSAQRKARKAKRKR